MAHSQYSLSWGEYRVNMCNGLSSLQQNGEFVDMTLAADGHYVKVHQVVLALTSPFIKDLIKSADCSHPVIFLNKISYGTLCSILEYIYTGEVMVSINNIDEFIEAGRELHIKGLEDMKTQDKIYDAEQSYEQTQSVSMEDLNEELCYFEVTTDDKADNETQIKFKNTLDNIKATKIVVEDTYNDVIEEYNNDYEMTSEPDKSKHNTEKTIDPKSARVMQYTVSNQGSLQMILNRYLYYLKHTNRNKTRQWRCVDYIASAKCPAYVVTKDDMVIQRISAHTHPFHDQKILKKVKSGAVFTAIQEAEEQGTRKRHKMPTIESHIDTE